MVSSVDERRHEPGADPTWVESWTFDFWSADGLLGGWVRFSLVPAQGRAWYHAFLTGPDRQLVAVLDHDVPLPARGLEIRTTGLWATHICETPLDHWTVGLEAFGLGVDDPEELYGRQFGDQVPLGFDLEWEADGAAEPVEASRYRQPCRVTGEILVGAEEIDLDGVGWRDHRWGPWQLHASVPPEIRGRLDDGTWFATVVERRRDGTSATTIGGRHVGIEPVATTPLEVIDPTGVRTRLPRVLCRCVTPASRSSFAWAEWSTSPDETGGSTQLGP